MYRALLLSDLCWRGALGLFTPVFAIFIVDRIEGGDAYVAGVAAMVGLVSKSVFQMVAAWIADRIPGERDDYWILVAATTLNAVMPLLYLVVRTPIELYIVQFLTNAALAFAFPTFMSIFGRHIDHKRAGTSWAVYFTTSDLGGAIAAGVGGAIVATAGFDAMIYASVVLGLFGALALLPARTHMRGRPLAK